MPLLSIVLLLCTPLTFVMGRVVFTTKLWVRRGRFTSDSLRHQLWILSRDPLIDLVGMLPTVALVLLYGYFWIQYDILETMATSTTVAECLTEKFTGNLPPHQVIFLRPELWNLSAPFQLNGAVDDGESTTQVSVWYRMVEPVVPSGMMNVNCTAAWVDPIGYANIYNQSKRNTAIPADDGLLRNSSFPRSFGFYGTPFELFYIQGSLTQLLQHGGTNASIPPVTLKTMEYYFLYGGTQSHPPLQLWMGSYTWASNRTIPISSELRGDVAAIVDNLAAWIAVNYVLLGVWYALHWLYFAFAALRCRRMQIAGVDEWSILKKRPTLLVIHRASMHQTKARHGIKREEAEGSEDTVESESGLLAATSTHYGATPHPGGDEFDSGYFKRL